jgi:hypothetical protein
MPTRRWWTRWIVWGLVGCVADVLVLGGGMGVAAGVPAVGLLLGLWAAWLAWRYADSRDLVLPLSVWGGIVSAGIAAHFTFVGELGLLLLLGPQEASRPILGELVGAGLTFLRGVVPPVLNSVGAFWIVQTLAFGVLELLCGLAGAWLGARLLLAREARLARWIERTWERLPKGLEAGLVVGLVAAVLSGPAFIVSAGVPLVHLLLAAPLGALAGWLAQRWAGKTQVPRTQVTLAGLLVGILVALGTVGIFALFTVAGPAGRTTLSATYEHLGSVSSLIPAWLDPLGVAFPVLSVLLVLIIVGLAVGGARVSCCWARQEAGWKACPTQEAGWKACPTQEAG